MSFTGKLKQAGIFRILSACTLLAILCIALYDLFHPNSRPTIATGIVVLLSGISAFYALRVRTLYCPRTRKQAILLLFFIGFILRAMVIVLFPNRQVSDFQIFHELAVTLAEGKGLAYDGPIGLSEDVALFRHVYGATGSLPTAFRMPGTPLVMATVYSVFGPHPLSAKLLNALVGAGIGLCLLLLLWGHDPRKAFWAGLLGEIYPSTLFNTNLLGTEIHFTFGIVLAALFFAKTFTVHKGVALLYALAAGLIMGYTCLIRPSTQLILCMMAVSVWQVWKRIHPPDRSEWKKALRLIGIMMLGIALPLTIWGYRNYRTFGVFEWQSSEIGFNFLTMTQNIIPPEKERSLDSLMTAFFRSQNEFEIARIAGEIGLRRLAMAVSQPGSMKTFIKNFMRTWKHDRDGLSWCLGFPKSDKTPEQAGDPVKKPPYQLLQRLIETGYVTLLVLALFGTIGIRRPEMENPGVMMMLLYFLGSCALLCIFQGQPRYHFPFVPLLCVFAACSIGSLRHGKTEYS